MVDVRAITHEMRLFKSADEVELMRRAAAITVDAEQIAEALPRVMAEHGVAIIANVASVDLGAKRQHEVRHNSEVADTQATRNLVDSLIPICKAIKRFPRLGSPRHALHVLVANLGSPKEAYEAGAERDWLPHDLQYDKDSSEKL